MNSNNRVKEDLPDGRFALVMDRKTKVARREHKARLGLNAAIRASQKPRRSIRATQTD